MVQKQKHNRCLGSNINIVRTFKITLPHLNKSKNVNMVGLDLLIVHNLGLITAMILHKKPKKYSRQAVGALLQATDGIKHHVPDYIFRRRCSI